MDNFSRRLTQSFTLPRQRARAIFRWIAENIAYDEQLVNTPESMLAAENISNVMATRKTICTGYSRLFDIMGKAAGLECEVIGGWSKQLTESGPPNHSWNAVKIDGQWQLLDAGWAAGSARGDAWRKEFNGWWFFPSPANFLQSHFPTHPAWQLVKPAWTKQDFEALPSTSMKFFDLGLALDSHLTKTIRVTGGKIQLWLQVPQEVYVNARLYQAQNELPIQPEVEGKLPGTSRYEWVFDLQGQRPDRLVVFASRDINSQSSVLE